MMIYALILFAAAIGVLAYAWRRDVKRLKKDVADEKSNGAGFLREKQAELDGAVAAAFVECRARVTGLVDTGLTVAQAFDREAEIEAERAMAIVAEARAAHDAENARRPESQRTTFDPDGAIVRASPVTAIRRDLDTRRASLAAATNAAQMQVAQAAQELQSVHAENTLLRGALEKALQLPIDTPPQAREMFLRRCNMVLTCPRPTYDCPKDDVWQSYVARHVEVNGDPFATPKQVVAGVPDGETKH